MEQRVLRWLFNGFGIVLSALIGTALAGPIGSGIATVCYLLGLVVGVAAGQGAMLTALGPGLRVDGRGGRLEE